LFDKDGDGKITTDELGPLMRSLSHNFTQDDVQEMIDEVDANGTRIMGFPEFSALLPRLMESNGAEDGLIKTFSAVDKDGAGFISAAELRFALTHLGKPWTDDVERMIKEADINGDGQLISSQEFIGMMMDQQTIEG